MNLRMVPMKVGDLRPYPQIQVFNPDGTPRNLTGSTLLFRMAKAGQPRKVDDPASPVVLTQGIIEYQWQVGDTNEAGQFRGVFVIDGIDTYPKDGYIIIDIEESV